MISLYTGTPGSGKSLHCAQVIYKKIVRGKNVLANFDINLTCFKPRKKPYGDFVYLDNSELSPELLMFYAVANHRRNTSGHMVEGQTLVVIDECQILFNSRDWNAKDRMAWATFFTQHRKYGFDIILITQFDRLIDRQIRSLVEYQVIHRKVSNFQTIGFLLGVLFHGNIFIAITQWYGIREKISAEWFVLRPKYARLYDSYKIFTPQAELGATGAPAKTEGENLTAKHTMRICDYFWLGVWYLICFIYMLRAEIAYFKDGARRDVMPDDYDPAYGSVDEFWTKKEG